MVDALDLGGQPLDVEIEKHIASPDTLRAMARQSTPAQQLQYSSSGKQRLGRITKAGDPYLRCLLVIGARALLALALNRNSRKRTAIPPLMVLV